MVVKVFRVVVNSLKSNSNRTIVQFEVSFINITNSAGFAMCQGLTLIVTGFEKPLIHEEQL